MHAGAMTRLAGGLLLLAMLGCDGDGNVIVEAHVIPDESCVVGPDSQILTQGLYDVFKAGVRTPIAGFEREDLPTSLCSNGYDLNLRVKNLSSESIVFDAASVLLETPSGKAIRFDRKGAKLANPFDARAAAPLEGSATGVVTVQVIPAAYGAELDAYRNDEIVARVTLLGTTESGGSAASRPFRFPIQLCFGCLYQCLNADLVTNGIDPDEVYGNQCADNAGADDRVCIDSDC